jgi:hypothetical protein
MAGIGGKPPMEPSGSASGLIWGPPKAVHQDNCVLTARFSAAC